jgi:hypothetical protein
VPVELEPTFSARQNPSQKPGAPMTPEAIQQHITQTFDGVHVIDHQGDLFFYYNPGTHQPDDLYFATLMQSDQYDKASNLGREGIYRLNLGLEKSTFKAHFGDHDWQPGPDAILQTGHDYTAQNTLIPHPYYGTSSWASILNPTPETFAHLIVPLLTEAHARALRKFQKRATARQATPKP